MVEHLTIKDKLVQFEDIKKEVYELEDKIDKLEKEGFKIASVKESRHRPPYGTHDIIIEAQSPKIKELISRYKSILKERYEELLEVQIELEEYISKLPTSRLRRIFTYRYIEQCTWRKISFMIKNTTEDSVRMEHNNFLKNN